MDPKDAVIQRLEARIEALMRTNADLRTRLEATQVHWVAKSVAAAVQESVAYHRGMLTGRCCP
jgi:hypothetical protein